METKRLNILHLTNTLGMGGVEKLFIRYARLRRTNLGFMQHQQEVYLLINSEYLGVKHYKIPGFEYK